MASARALWVLSMSPAGRWCGVLTTLTNSKAEKLSADQARVMPDHDKKPEQQQAKDRHNDQGRDHFQDAGLLKSLLCARFLGLHEHREFLVERHQRLDI